MGIKTCKVLLEGIAPLIHHQATLVDPLHPLTIELKKYTSKSKKTEDDHKKIAEIEFKTSLYLGDDDEPCIPANMIFGTLKASGKLNRLGETVKKAIYCNKNAKLVYEGPKNSDGLFNNSNFVDRRVVTIGRGDKMIRTRPIFSKWKVDIEFSYNDELIDKSQLEVMLTNFEKTIGFGDNHPQYGRSKVLKIKYI